MSNKLYIVTLAVGDCQQEVASCIHCSAYASKEAAELAINKLVGEIRLPFTKPSVFDFEIHEVEVET